MTFHIRRNERPDEGLRRIAVEQIGFVLRDFRDPEVSDDARIHSLRARCKKMRALLRLVQPVMGDAWAREDARFRDAGKLLGSMRDDYVQHRTLCELHGREAEKRSGADQGIDADALDAAVESMHEALHAVRDWPFEATGFYDLAPGYGRSWSKGRSAWQRALQARNDENFHRLRRWSKYLWYQTRILERMKRRVLHRQRVRLQVMGELLGHAHDLAILEHGHYARVDRATEKRAARRKQRLYIKALRLASVTYEKTADEQVASCADWWQHWREERHWPRQSQSSPPTERKSTPSERNLR